MQNDLFFLHSTLGMLKKNGIETIVFGGWAEELHKMIAPKEHKDIDLLYPAADFTKIDVFISTSPKVMEINRKRFDHKRAFLYEGIMVELILLKEKTPGQFVTNFWNDYELAWPDLSLTTIMIPSIDAIPVISPTALKFYREKFLDIENVRAKHLSRRDGSKVSLENNIYS